MGLLSIPVLIWSLLGLACGLISFVETDGWRELNKTQRKVLFISFGPFMWIILLIYLSVTHLYNWFNNLGYKDKFYDEHFDPLHKPVNNKKKEEFPNSFHSLTELPPPYPIDDK